MDEDNPHIERMPMSTLPDRLKEVVRLLDVGRVEMAADLMGEYMISMACEYKYRLCHNGPEDMSPFLGYVAKEKLAIIQVMSGWEDPDTAVKLTLDLMLEQMGPPTLVSMVSEVLVADEVPEDERTLQDLRNEGDDCVVESIGSVTVHHYEEGFRVISYSRGFDFGDGELKLADRGYSADTMLGYTHEELGTHTLSIVTDFMKENPQQ